MDVYMSKVDCECGKTLRISFTEIPNSVIPRKCDDCGYNLNKIVDTI
jgi:hypothetical protein